jgi:nucleoside-diphosphate-sugar epimerase
MLKSSCSQSYTLHILLTGATGSLGSNVVAEAARCGLEVRAVLLGTPNDFAAYNGIDVPVAVNLADRRSLSADWPRRGRRERLACGDRDIRARRRAPPARQ